jgi:hypothetical protein
MQGKGCPNFPDLAEWPIKRRDCDSDASSKSRGIPRNSFLSTFILNLCTPPTQNEISFFQGGVIRNKRAAKFEA